MKIGAPFKSNNCILLFSIFGFSIIFCIINDGVVFLFDIPSLFLLLWFLAQNANVIKDMEADVMTFLLLCIICVLDAIKIRCVMYNECFCLWNVHLAEI